MTQLQGRKAYKSSPAHAQEWQAQAHTGPTMAQRPGVRYLGALAIFALLAMLAVSIQAQVLYGTLLGNVTDQSGAVVVGASVVATNIATEVSAKAVTDSSGIYRFSNLQTGRYKVTITAPSFATTNAERLLIQTNVELRFDAQLHPATVGQSVTVTSAPPELQTDSATPTSELETEQVQNIDTTAGLNMRNFQSLLILVPGINPPVETHSESGNPSDTMIYNANGMSGSNNFTRIDGISDIYAWLPEITAYSPSTEAIATVNVVTNSMNPEQGFASGAAVNVTTKSGTNKFHGSAWEYNMVSALMAKPYTLPSTSKLPKYILNEFGANYGGPIIKNRAFFFANWERFRRSEALSGFQSVPSAAMLAGNFAGITDSKGNPVTIYDPESGNPDGTGRVQIGSAADNAYGGSGTPNVMSASQISYAASQMAKLLQTADAPNVAGANLLTVNGITNDFYGAADGEYTRDNIDSRVDFNPSSKSTLFGRYGIQKTGLFDPQTLGAAGGTTFDGGQPGNAPSIIQSVGIGGTYTFGTNLLLDGNVGYLRQGMAAKNVDIGKDWGLSYFNIPGTNGSCSLCGGMPGFFFSGLSNLGNQNNSNPFQFRDNTYTAAANLSWTRGRHATRYGIEFDRFDINHFQPQNTYGPRGGFQFSGGLTALPGGLAPNLFNSWADFMFGDPQLIQKDTQYLNPASSRESVWAMYAQDQWQATVKLTVTYGIRYEYYPMITRDHSGMDIFNPADGNLVVEGASGVPSSDEVDMGKGMVVPRLGLAYRINSKTVVRTGFGISANPDSLRNVLTTYPSVVSQTIQGNTTYLSPIVNGAPDTLTVGIPALTPPTLSPSNPVVALGTLGTPAGSLGATTFPMKYRRGYYESYNAAVEREFSGSTTLNLTYIGELIRREVPGININAAQAPGQTATQQPLYVLYGIKAGVTSETPDGTGNYNALEAQAKKRFSNDSMVAVNYTYSRGINDYGANSDGEGSLLIAMASPYWHLNRGVSSIDRTHNIQIFGNYVLPFGKGQAHLQHGPAGFILGGWSLAGSLSRESGYPFNVTGSGTSLGPSISGSTQLADEISKSDLIMGGHNKSRPYFNPADFADPSVAEKAQTGSSCSTSNTAACRFGTAGRNPVRGPGITNPSVNVARMFTITERFGLEFRAEAFNVTNTPQLSNPNASVTGGSFGYITASTGNSSRELRFSGRVNF